MGYKGTRTIAENRGNCHGHVDDGPLHDHLGRQPRRREPRDVPRVPRPEVPRRLRRLAQQVQEPVQGPARHRPAASATGTTSAATPTRTRDGIVGEVIFPNTVPPFFPSFVLFAGAADARGVRAPPRRHPAHNRWLVDFCGEFPERRAGIGQIFLNDVDDAIDDVKWIKEHGLRGGVLAPERPARREVGEAALRPGLRPAVGGAARTSRSRSTRTAAPARPTTASTRRSPTAHASPRCRFYSQRPFVQLMLSRRVRALPEAQVRDDRDGLRVDPAAARAARRRSSPTSRKGEIGELRYTEDNTLPRARPPSTSTQNCWVGASQPGPADAAARDDDRRRPLHVGQRLPARRGHLPVHHASTCARCSTTPTPTSSQRLLAGNAAKLYDFDLDALAPLADAVRPDGRRDRAAAHRAPREPQRGAHPRRGGHEADRLIARCSTSTSSTSFRPVSNGISPTPGRSSTNVVAPNRGAASGPMVISPSGNAPSSERGLGARPLSNTRNRRSVTTQGR